MNTNCSDWRPLLIDYIDGQLAPAIRAKVEEHVKSCADCTAEVKEFSKLFEEISAAPMEQPSPALKENFQNMLQSELNIAATMEMLKKKQEPTVIAIKKSTIWLQIAASLILVFGGVFAGMQMKNDGPSSREIAGMKTELQQMKEAMMLNLLSGESASDRIRAVSYAEEFPHPNPTVIEALFHTVNSDNNVNVRLAAANSLARFSNDPAIMDSLVASLRRQKEPLVQIVLITILTDKKEPKAIGPIRDIISNKETLQPVKQVAEEGLKKVI